MSLLKKHILAFFVISTIGTLLHFVYELSNNTYLIGIFTPVNESVFEHLKMIIYPIILVMGYEHIMFKGNSNYILAKVVSIITAMLVIITIFYTYTTFTNNSVIIIDIITYYVSIFIGELCSYKILKNKNNKDYGLLNKHSKIMLISLIWIFMFCTFYPPKLDIFRDPITNTYGILKLTK